MVQPVPLRRDALVSLGRAALVRSGADPHSAEVLAEATADAEFAGKPAVGVAHLLDHLDGYREGRIAADVRPVVRRLAAAVLDVDARGGLAQTAFAAASAELEEAARESGLAALWIRSSYTGGELGHYPRRLARRGFVAVAMANTPALMSLGGAPTSVVGTNPLAYGLPRPGRPPLVVDQASSSTAFVNVRRAAEAGEAIPAGWALGPDGEPTRDAAAALHGTLLPFGGFRGGNIALLVEVLATLSGASFSVDAPPFDRGSRSPGIGLFILCVDPGCFPGATDRLAEHLDALRADHGVRLPALDRGAPPDAIEIDADTLARLEQAARS